MPSYACLVIDMQEHFRAGMAEEIVGPLNKLTRACRLAGVPVVYTQHGHPDPEVEAASSVLVKFWGAANSIRLGSKAWELLPELERGLGDVVISSKRTYDAFKGTELEELLRRQGVDTVMIGGVMTNLCCETTARSAFTKDFEVVFLEDGTATATEAMQRATLLNIRFGFGRVARCEEAAAEL